MNSFSPNELRKKLPLTPDQKKRVEAHRSTIRNLIHGKDPRLALVFGPCSIHSFSSAIEYGNRFCTLAAKITSNCFCAMRVYIEKPRTIGGWKGFVYDPQLSGLGSLPLGILEARKLFLHLIDLNIPIATEILHPLLAPFFSDLISWGFIGARTSASQPHRELASYLPFPIGFKNSQGGNIQQAIHGMIVASQPHHFPLLGQDGQLTTMDSDGNPSTHVVLRGSDEPNYDPFSIAQTEKLLYQAGFSSRILIDCAHGNCQKQHPKQKEAFLSVAHQAYEGNGSILGMMLESHLEEGSQLFTGDSLDLREGVSITDPCLGWEATESLISSLFSSKVMS